MGLGYLPCPFSFLPVYRFFMPAEFVVYPGPHIMHSFVYVVPGIMPVVRAVLTRPCSLHAAQHKAGCHQCDQDPLFHC